MLAGIGAVQLLERFEDVVHPVFGNAGAGIVNGEAQVVRGAIVCREAHAKPDVALLGELDCIAQQVTQNVGDVIAIPMALVAT